MLFICVQWTHLRSAHHRPVQQAARHSREDRGDEPKGRLHADLHQGPEVFTRSEAFRPDETD